MDELDAMDVWIWFQRISPTVTGTIHCGFCRAAPLGDEVRFQSWRSAEAYLARHRKKRQILGLRLHTCCLRPRALRERFALVGDAIALGHKGTCQCCYRAGRHLYRVRDLHRRQAQVCTECDVRLERPRQLRGGAFALQG